MAAGPTSGMTAAAPFLRLDGITKSYAGVRALRGLSMSASAGEVIGLVGENGAGKSTLMKVLGGVVAPDGGEVTIDGVSHPALTVAGSMAAGIAFVHQELNLFDNLDVAGNVLMAREPRRGGWLNLVDRRRQRELVAPILRRIGASFGPDTPVAKLSLAQQQMVEIAKALAASARLVILDEPTSSLPLSETDRLLEVIAGLKSEGVAVIFITHRLHEIERIADRVVALRDGSLAGELARDEISHDRMVRLMIGRNIKAQRTEAATPGPLVLSARGIGTAAYPGRTVDLDLHAGEILGLAGLVGAGRTEVARVLFGIDPAGGGTIELNGAPLQLRSAADAVAHGIFLIPEDRKGCGLLLDFPIQENVSLPDMRRHSHRFLISRAREAATAATQRDRLGIKAADLRIPARSLSGGNQQKVVLAKWLAMTPKVIILDEPTRGIDVGAKAEIYRLMRDLASAGVALLVISTDMEEVLAVSDRIAVMHEGRVSGTLAPEQFSEENVLLLAVGRGIPGRRAA